MRRRSCGSQNAGCATAAIALGVAIVLVVVCPWRIWLLLSGVVLIIAGLWYYRG